MPKCNEQKSNNKFCPLHGCKNELCDKIHLNNEEYCAKHLCDHLDTLAEKNKI